MARPPFWRSKKDSKMAESDNDKFGEYLFVNCFIYFFPG